MSRIVAFIIAYIVLALLFGPIGKRFGFRAFKVLTFLLAASGFVYGLLADTPLTIPIHGFGFPLLSWENQFWNPQVGGHLRWLFGLAAGKALFIVVVYSYQRFKHHDDKFTKELFKKEGLDLAETDNKALDEHANSFLFVLLYLFVVTNCTAFLARIFVYLLN